MRKYTLKQKLVCQGNLIQVYTSKHVARVKKILINSQSENLYRISHLEDVRIRRNFP